MRAAHILAASASFLAFGTFAAAAETASAMLKNADGANVGSATLTQTPSGVLIRLSLKGLPAGEHAFHVRGVGKCEPPFTSAGGHFNPGSKKHGIMAGEGHHAGDMPNLHIPATGELTVGSAHERIGSTTHRRTVAARVHAHRSRWPQGDVSVPRLD